MPGDGERFKIVGPSTKAENVTAVVASSSTATVTFGNNVALTALPAAIPADDHKIYFLVGKVASDWAHVEHTLDLIIWELADIAPQKGASITAQMLGVYNRCKTIIALLKLLQEATGKDLQNLINDTTEIMNRQSGPGDKRNRIVHDPWYYYTDVQQVAQFKAMAHKEWKYGITPVDLEFLDDALKSIKQFGERVVKLSADITKWRNDNTTVR